MSYHLPQNSPVWSTTTGLKLPANLQFILKNLSKDNQQSVSKSLSSPFLLMQYHSTN